MTYFRVIHTIMGPKCLTAVFGMGTGVATWVWSPARRICKPRGEVLRTPGFGSTLTRGACENNKRQRRSCFSDALLVQWCEAFAPTDEGGLVKETINAVKRLAVSTGSLRPLRALHFRPIDLVVFQEPSLVTQPETCSCRGFHA